MRFNQSHGESSAIPPAPILIAVVVATGYNIYMGNWQALAGAVVVLLVVLGAVLLTSVIMNYGRAA